VHLPELTGPGGADNLRDHQFASAGKHKLFRIVVRLSDSVQFHKVIVVIIIMLTEFRHCVVTLPLLLFNFVVFIHLLIYFVLVFMFLLLSVCVCVRVCMCVCGCDT
jgi:hypothetical protein